MYSRLLELYNGKSLDLERRMDLDNFFECEVGDKYKTMLDFCKNKGYKRVFDVGCAYGTQSEVFIDSRIEYVGINDHKLPFWNSDKYEYIIKRYPFEIKTKEGDIAVSTLCLTWNCYLYNGETTLNEQLSQLSKDFESAILHITKDKLDYVAKYFPVYEYVNENTYYFKKN